MDKFNDDKNPQIMLSVYINKNNEIEEVNIDSYFVSTDELQYIDDEFNSYLLEDHGLLKLIKESDTLYHVYARVDFYKSGYYEVEYDSNVTFFDIIPVIRNYSEYLKAEEDYQEQKTLCVNDSNIDDFDSYGISYFGNRGHNITFNDLCNLVNIIAEYDNRLAHRLVGKNYTLQDFFKSFDKDISNLEIKRMEFKDFLKYNSNLNVRYDVNGYIITNKNYSCVPCNETILIGYNDIDNLSDEILLKYEKESLLEYFYNTKEIINTFNKYEIKG